MSARALAAIALAAVLNGCATTRVTTSEPDAVIWFDGRPVGTSGTVLAMGPPHTARVLVVARDGRRARALVTRELTRDTVEAGFHTMGFCLVFCWSYPEAVHVPLPPRERKVAWDDDPAASAWAVAPVDRWALPPPARAGPGPGPEKLPSTSTSSASPAKSTSTRAAP
ncbi:MAG TPA: hypothetical protein VF894_08755 [Anaeromyxobacter sp.]